MASRASWLLGLSAAGAIVFGPGLVQQLQMSLRQRAVDREVKQLEAAHQALLEERRRLTSDPAYVEDLVRSTFKVSKPGELVVPLEDDGSGQAR